MIKLFMLSVINFLSTLLYYSLVKGIVLEYREAIKEIGKIEMEAIKEDNQTKFKHSKWILVKSTLISIALLLLIVVAYVNLSRSIAEMYYLSEAL